MRPHLLAAAALSTAVLGGCGSATTATTTATTTTPSPTSVPDAVFPVVLARTGGIAGFADRLAVRADGSAEPSTRRGPGAPCRLTADTLQRLQQAVTLLAASPSPSATTSARVSDELVTTVQTPASRQTLRLTDASRGATSVVGELLTEVGADPASRALCPPG